jgi:hypothetical protein
MFHEVDGWMDGWMDCVYNIGEGKEIVKETPK